MVELLLLLKSSNCYISITAVTTGELAAMKSSKGRSKSGNKKENINTKSESSAASNETTRYKLRFPLAKNLGIYPRKDGKYVFGINRNEIQSSDLSYVMEEWTNSMVNSNKDINDEWPTVNEIEDKIELAKTLGRQYATNGLIQFKHSSILLKEKCHKQQIKLQATVTQQAQKGQKRKRRKIRIQNLADFLEHSFL